MDRSDGGSVPWARFLIIPANPKGVFARACVCTVREVNPSEEISGKIRSCAIGQATITACTLAGYRLPGTHTQDNAGTKTQAMVEIPTV
jgi:hypothetical protein